VKVIGNLTKDAIIRAAVSEGVNISASAGSAVTFEAANTNQIAVDFDSSNNKMVVAYSDVANSGSGTAIVGTISGDSVSYGSAATFLNGSTCVYIEAIFDSNSNKIVIAFTHQDGTNYGKAVVGTVSGTSISFGSVVTFNSGSVEDVDMTFDSNSNKVVITYRDTANSNYGTAIVGTVSGTSISFGTEVVFDSQNTQSPSPTFDSSNNKVVIAYKDFGSSIEARAVVGTVSGTSISFGSTVAFTGASADNFSAVFDTNNNKVVIAYRDANNSDYGTAIVGTVSGTSISFGTAVVFNAGNSTYINATFDSTLNKVLIVYKDNDNSNYGAVVEGTVSGTSISFSDELNFNTSNTLFSRIAYDTNQKKSLIAYRQSGTEYGDSRVYTTSNVSASGGTIADGSAVIVNANGTVSSVSLSALSDDVGTASVFETTRRAQDSDIAFDSVNKKHLIVWYDPDSPYNGKAIVATVASDGTITYGSAVTYHSAGTADAKVVFDEASGSFLITYRDTSNSNYGTAVVATISGDTVTFGSDVVFEDSLSDQFGLTYDSNAQKIAVSYRRTGSENVCRVATISGTSVSFGNAENINNSNGILMSSAFDSTNNKIIVAYRDQGNSDYGECRVGTISGNVITFGSVVVFYSGNTMLTDSAVSYDTENEKVVISYRDSTNSNQGKAVVGTVSGTSISFGSAVTFASDQTDFVASNYDPVAKKIIVCFKDTTDSNKGKVIVGTVSGTSISFGTEALFANHSVEHVTNTFDSNVDRSVTVFTDAANGDEGEAFSFRAAHDATNLTSENFVGFMDGAALDGTNGEILSSCSIARNQTSLTAGQTYFVSPTDGALSTSAGSPSVTAGTAISSTEIIVKG